ncbi:MAG: hypothetical protein AAGU21_08335 [Solidesulfovibrio sp.]|uniref:hypothetical protein n=1 Tax=Solidesulfovibrio sp. TaxID=2910990 RepID=UPI0031596CAC
MGLSLDAALEDHEELLGRAHVHGMAGLEGMGEHQAHVHLASLVQGDFRGVDHLEVGFGQSRQGEGQDQGGQDGGNGFTLASCALQQFFATSGDKTKFMYKTSLLSRYYWLNLSMAVANPAAGGRGRARVAC